MENKPLDPKVLRKSCFQFSTLTSKLFLLKGLFPLPKKVNYHRHSRWLWVPTSSVHFQSVCCFVSSSSILSCSSWFSMYFLIISSVIPTVLTKYPLAQNLLPQYTFINSGYLLNKWVALSPLSHFKTCEMEYLGGTDRYRCT